MRHPPLALAFSLLGLALLGLVTLARAQDPSATDEPPVIFLAPAWSVGDAYEVEYVKKRQRFKGEEKVLDGGSRTRIQVEVVSEDDSSFVLKWTWGESELFGESTADSPFGNHPLLKDLARLNEGLAMVLRTDEFGSIARLENEDGVRDHFRKAIDLVMEVVAESGGVSSGEAEMVRKMVTDLYESEQSVWMLTQEPSLFYSASGLALPLGEPLGYEDELMNPLGGPPFPAHGVYEFTAYDADSGLATLEWVVAMDPEGARETMIATFEALARKQGAPPLEDADSLGAIDIRDSSNVVYDVPGGLPVRFFWMRTVEAEGDRQVDVKEFQVRDQEKQYVPSPTRAR